MDLRLHRSHMRPRVATIKGIRQLTEKEKLFSVKFDDGESIKFIPCQFVMVSLLGIGEAPISIASSPLDSGEGLELCIRSAGNLTGAIHRLSENDKIGIRGPYGNGMPMERFIGRDILIVAGGLGLVPLRSLIRYIRERRQRYGRVVILIGAKRPHEVLFRDELEIWEKDTSFEIYTTVDAAERGWHRDIGPVTGLFRYAKNMKPIHAAAVVVGPPIMYRFVLLELLKMGIFEGNIFLSLERRMRCGIGKCGHCQINGIYLCKDGPVLSYRMARKLMEAL